tara:strand:- start:62 stop:424 length:363 start_codon:yes stop_codon:yes gene_type:complete
MKFHSNKHREGQVRVQPEHKETAACGTPIANAEVNTPRRDTQGELLQKLWDLSCQTLQTVYEYKTSLKAEDFKNAGDHEAAKKAWYQQSMQLYKFHEFIHSHHVNTSWTEWTTIDEEENK